MELHKEVGPAQTTIAEIARRAGVQRLTVYNHFPTKPDLVLDRDQELSARLTTAIVNRGPGVSPAAAIRDIALSMLDGLSTMDDAQVRGGLGYLSVRSPSVRRLSLEMTDRLLLPRDGEGADIRLLHHPIEDAPERAGGHHRHHGGPDLPQPRDHRVRAFIIRTHACSFRESNFAWGLYLTPQPPSREEGGAG